MDQVILSRALTDGVVVVGNEVFGNRMICTEGLPLTAGQPLCVRYTLAQETGE
ncbi:MAG: hypothetical protein KF791_20835 [Verrucomicrobiae bacterium]|nr:hypothetical protein [Verrucomicrobiae bacterium]